MGLGFHIPQQEGDEQDIYLGQMDMDEHYYLQENGFIAKGKTGHRPDDSEESLPYFDDVELTPKQVDSIKTTFDARRKIAMKTPGFKSEAVEKMFEILTKAQDANKGLNTCAD